MTFWQLLFLVFVFGFFGLIGFKTIPIYLDYYNAAKDVREVARSGNFNPEDPATVDRALGKKWDIDYIKYLDYHDVKMVKKNNGVFLEYSYEVRQHLMYNVDIVLSFSDSVALPTAAG
jgi:hypothetical protein